MRKATLTSALVSLVVACGTPAVAVAAPTPDWWSAANAFLQAQPGAECTVADFVHSVYVTGCTISTGPYANSHCDGTFVGDLTPGPVQREPDLYSCTVANPPFGDYCGRGDGIGESGRDIAGGWRRNYDRAFLTTLDECLTDPRLAVPVVGKPFKLRVVRGAVVVPLRVYRRASCRLQVDIRLITAFRPSGIPKTFRDFDHQQTKGTYNPGRRRARLPIKASTVKALRGHGTRQVGLSYRCTAKSDPAGRYGTNVPVDSLVLPKKKAHS